MWLINVFLCYCISHSIVSHHFNSQSIPYMSFYPYSQNVSLPNNVVAGSVISLFNMTTQKAIVRFMNIDDDLVGTINLDSANNTLTNLKYHGGKQILIISTITFTSAQEGIAGSITCSGNVTDENGENNVTFTDALLCSWSPK